MNKIPVTVIRHPKERLSKCSLEPLYNRPEITFLKASPNLRFDCTNFILLSIDAPELSSSDANHPLLLLDSTWKLLPSLEACLLGQALRRSLPINLRTAYPRTSKIAQDPLNGLASIEALYIAKYILGENDPSLLDAYHWKNEFLTANPMINLSLQHTIASRQPCLS